jgi:LPS export ABC transporter protein LptC
VPVALLAALLLAVPCGVLGQDAEGTGDPDTERITLELGGMTYVASAGTANEMVIAADHATIHPDAERADLRDMHATIAPAAAEGRSGGLDMTCDRGTFELATGDFVAEGDVRGVTGDGRRFRTTRLRYHHDEGLVVADVPVEIRDAAGRYRGGGFRYWVRENRFRLSGGATVVQDKEQ